MANIHVVVEKPIADGYKLKFRTPCESTTIEGLEVKYPAKNGVGTLIKKFTFKDAHGTELSGVGNLFVSGVMIEVLLDVTYSVAYIQNADTNSYVESFKGEIKRLEEAQKQFLGVAGESVEKCESATAAAMGATAGATAAANNLVLTHNDFVSGGYVEALKELNAGDKFRFWVGTQAEYDALEKKPNDTLCLITDDATNGEIASAINEINEYMVTQNGINDNFNTSIQEMQTDIKTLDEQLKEMEEMLNINQTLWTGNASVSKDVGSVTVDVPGISKYSILNIDGDVYIRGGKMSGMNVYTCTNHIAQVWGGGEVTKYGVTIPNGATTQVIESKRVLLDGDRLYLYNLPDFDTYVYNRTIVFTDYDVVIAAHYEDMTITEIRGVI